MIVIHYYELGHGNIWDDVMHDLVSWRKLNESLLSRSSNN